jgi:hypothetical protein
MTVPADSAFGRVIRSNVVMDFGLPGDALAATRLFGY